MNTVQLGQSDLHVTPICLGTMTFGEQVDEPDAHAILTARWSAASTSSTRPRCTRCPRGPKPVAPPKPSSATGLLQNPGRAPESGAGHQGGRALRAACPGCAAGGGMTAADIVASCNSLRRLQTDVIDLYQIHWPERHVPAFGIALYFDPAKDKPQTSHPRAAGSPGRAGQGRQGAPHRPVQRNALWRARVRAPGRTARPAARGQRAEPLLPDQPHRGQRLDETLHRWACRCWPTRRWALAC
jgi:hypothetical protein